MKLTFYVNAILGELFPILEGLNMKFSRKLVVKNGSYGTISVPKPVLDSWESVENVILDFDENHNILVIRPVEGDLA
jgi:hypothetical protein